MAKKPLSEALQRLLSRLDGSYPDGGFILIGMPSTTEEADVTVVSNLDPDVDLPADVRPCHRRPRRGRRGRGRRRAAGAQAGAYKAAPCTDAQEGCRASTKREERQMSSIDHPPHYGGSENPYETIKVLEAWMTRDEMIGFCKGNALKYLSRHREKGGLQRPREVSLVQPLHGRVPAGRRREADPPRRAGEAQELKGAMTAKDAERAGQAAVSKKHERRLKESELLTR